MEDIEKEWGRLILDYQDNFDDELGVKSMLFLIGVQELGQGVRDFNKEEKTNLFHIAVCKILSAYGYYRFKSVDEDGWPHWEKLKDYERLGVKKQKLLMKKAIINYFK